jgi:polyhydroxyalkanoate synthase
VWPATAELQTAAGTRERGGSPWLGQSLGQSRAYMQYQDFDHWLMSCVGRWTWGQSPITLGQAFGDWWTHLLASPAKQLELVQRAWEAGFNLLTPDQPEIAECPGLEPLSQDKRFIDEQWRAPPFVWWVKSFLLTQGWWHCATIGVPGVSKHHEDMVSFGARQWLDVVSPSNFPWSNPVVLNRTIREFGLNLRRGLLHALEDAWVDAMALPPVGADQYQVGRNIGVTPGAVVFRNRLIELIQYAPQTSTTKVNPVLVIPAWIMKYYVLDLSPKNSVVQALVEQGFTVFAISWKNPESSDRDLGWQDYDRLGIRSALDVIAQIMPNTETHAVGYCIGGTLLAMSASALGREQSSWIRSISLLAAQTDFTDPGELSLFIDEGQVRFLENQMWRNGYLDERQMKGAFQMLRSKDLVWSYRVLNYLLGERRPMTDLMAWNADGTRLPLRMHSEYLRSFFLHNALSHGEFKLNGIPVNLEDIKVPIFNVGAVQDHVAPWRSVFRLHQLTHAPQTFVLTAGGHNVGIVNPPGSSKSSYRVSTWRGGDRILTPEEWLEHSEFRTGSWWGEWFEWLTQHSSGLRAPPVMGAPQSGLLPLCAAPGTYVYIR